ncbi:MAG TPA: hypothetical protein VM901_07675 [Bdellovibrionota bacterium]|jgi:hypothetical protein|nr:hypothetical protein [Bdellovibrionota bacterium]
MLRAVFFALFLGTWGLAPSVRAQVPVNKPDPLRDYVGAGLEDALLGDQPAFVDYDKIFALLPSYDQLKVNYHPPQKRPWGRTITDTRRYDLHYALSPTFLVKTQAQRAEGAEYREQYFGQLVSGIYENEKDPVGTVLRDVDRKLAQIVIGDLQRGTAEKPLTPVEVDRRTNETFMLMYRRNPAPGNWEDDAAIKRIRQRVEFETQAKPELKPAVDFEETKKKILSMLKEEDTRFRHAIVDVQLEEFMAYARPRDTVSGDVALLHKDGGTEYLDSKLRRADVAGAFVRPYVNDTYDHRQIIYQGRDGRQYSVLHDGYTDAFMNYVTRSGMNPDKSEYLALGPGSAKLAHLTRYAAYEKFRSNYLELVEAIKKSSNLLELYKQVEKYRSENLKAVKTAVAEHLSVASASSASLVTNPRPLSDIKWWGFKQNPNYWRQRTEAAAPGRRKSLNDYLVRHNRFIGLQSKAHSVETLATGTTRLAAYLVPAWLLLSPMWSSEGTPPGTTYVDKVLEKAAAMGDKGMEFKDHILDTPNRWGSRLKSNGGGVISPRAGKPGNSPEGANGEGVAFRVQYNEPRVYPEYFRIGDINFEHPYAKSEREKALVSLKTQRAATIQRLRGDGGGDGGYHPRRLQDDDGDSNWGSDWGGRYSGHHETYEESVRRLSAPSGPMSQNVGDVVDYPDDKAGVILETNLKVKVTPYQYIPLPTPYLPDAQGNILDYQVTGIQVRDQKGRPVSSLEHQVYEKNGAFFLWIDKPDVEKIDYKVRFISNGTTSSSGSILFKREHLLPIADQLEEAGMKALADRLRDHLRTAEAISTEGLARLLGDSSLYSYVPEAPQKPYLDIRNPFSEMSHFAVDGVLCYQCSGASRLNTLIQNEYFARDPQAKEFQAQQWVVFYNNLRGTDGSLPDELSFKELHATTATYSNRYEGIRHSDATPSRMDPRNPVYKRPGEDFDKFLKKLKEKWAEAEKKLPIKEYFNLMAELGPYDHRFQRMRGGDLEAEGVKIEPPSTPPPDEKKHVAVQAEVDRFEQLWLVEQRWKDQWRPTVLKEVQKLDNLMAISPARQQLGPQFQSLPHQNIFKLVVDLRNYLENSLTPTSNLETLLKEKAHMAKVIKALREQIKATETRIFEDFTHIAAGQKVNYDYASNFRMIRAMALETLPMLEKAYAAYPKSLRDLEDSDFATYLARRPSFIARSSGERCPALVLAAGAP